MLDALDTVPIDRIAIPAATTWIRAMIPSRLPGVYLFLSRQGQPLYVGRSDSCLLSRLAQHEMLHHATHVVWNVCRDPVRAFFEEAYLYDRYKGDGSLLNMIHPARPHGYDGDCPFCSIDVSSVRQVIEAGRAISVRRLAKKPIIAVPMTA